MRTHVVIYVGARVGEAAVKSACEGHTNEHDCTSVSDTVDR